LKRRRSLLPPSSTFKGIPHEPNSI
jgi:hypothetical protein